MLHIYTGRNRLLAGALIESLRSPGPQTRLIVVPKQLTLQTERMLLEGLNLRGSFQLQVLSAQRLCQRVFEAAGQPDGVRVDDRGRVMLVRAAVRAAEENLTIYRGAERRRGFSERAAAQLERIRQARITAETLRDCADQASGSTRLKLCDLSHILESYESLIEGRYQDGEAEFHAAIARVRDADFLRQCDVWFFGFDMMPPTLHELIAAIAAVCEGTHLFLPLENDSHARDFDVFLPMQQAFDQLTVAARRWGACWDRIDLEESFSAQKPAVPLSAHRERRYVSGAARRADLERLERELFARSPKPSDGPANAVQLTLLRDPLEECMFAAALIRRLIQRRGWRWNDVLILCKDLDAYAAPLQSVFATYGVPLFLASSRSAARHATAECLLTALRVLEKNCPAEDMAALMQTGLMPVSADEADRLSNYAIRYGLRGARFLRPLRRGSEAEIAALEPVRDRLTQPLVRLRDRLRRAETLEAQLRALFEFLTDIDAYDKSLSRMNRLAEAGLRAEAGEEGQVWNRILGALDQMQALMGGERLSLRELRETLSESLSASVIKALPQSDDAVYAQRTDTACTRTARAILILGASDRPVSEEEGLLTPSQKRALSTYAHAYLGPDDADLSRLKRFYLKSALGMASDYVSVSCPLSGSDGAAQRPGALFEMIENLFPGTRARGGLSGDPSVERMLRGAPGAAVTFAARALAAASEGAPLSDVDRAAISALVRIARTPAHSDAKVQPQPKVATAPPDTDAPRQAETVTTDAPRGAMCVSPESTSAASASEARLAAQAIPASGCSSVKQVESTRLAVFPPIAADSAHSGDMAQAVPSTASASGAAVLDSSQAHPAARRLRLPLGPSEDAALTAREGLRRLRAALNRAQSADALAPQTARALYGALHRQSITQLELFAGCPFSYFTRYGLRPEKIEPFELNARDEGVFFHQAVQEFLLRSREDLNALATDVAQTRMDGIADALLDVMQQAGPLGDSAVSLAQRRKLKATARACAAALADHMRGSLFHTAALEQNFGREDGALALRLPGGCVLEGRIDRIDEWSGIVEGAAPADYLRVIDFKRGGKALKLAEAYYGLSLQLPVYLAAAQRKRGGQSAGVYYFTLSDGIFATQNTNPGAVEDERRKNFRMEGLLPGNQDLLKAMSPNYPEVLKVRVTGSGALYKGTLTASAADYDRLSRCALRHAQEHIDRIESGECRAAPARIEQSDACQYCDYRPLCLFDDRMDAGRARKFKTLSGAEVLEKLALEDPEAQS